MRSALYDCDSFPPYAKSTRGTRNITLPVRSTVGSRGATGVAVSTDGEGTLASIKAAVGMLFFEGSWTSRLLPSATTASLTAGNDGRTACAGQDTSGTTDFNTLKRLRSGRPLLSLGTQPNSITASLSRPVPLSVSASTFKVMGLVPSG